MRAAILVLAALAATATLAGCKNNDQLDQTQNVDENLTAENFVSNDVTAIDAVTGDAANMAADSDILFGNLEAPDENAGNEATSPSPGKPSSKPSTEKNQSSESTTANTTANSVETNAE
jgi:outer membrane murein-binding lipoprotein Lpp